MHWEGCRLTGYPNPISGGGPWTLGQGHTGPEERPGLTIREEQTDAWLHVDVGEEDAGVVIDPLIEPAGGLTVRQREGKRW
jgi:lysozyme